MALAAQVDRPPFRADAHGVVRIGSTRVSLDVVIEAFREGASAEEILLRYSSLDLADIYATIAYYLRHQEQVDGYLLDQEAQAEAARRDVEQHFDTRALRERLARRRSA